MLFDDEVLGVIVLAVVLLAPGGFASVPDLFGRIYRRFRPESEPAPSAEEESPGETIGRFDAARALESSAIQGDAVEKGKVLLHVAGLSRRFGGLRAVEGVDLDVHEAQQRPGRLSP